MEHRGVGQRERKKTQKKAQDADDDSDELEKCIREEKRRVKKLQRRAKKMRAHFAALGLDEFGEPLDNFSLLKYPVREWKFTVPGFLTDPIAINPAVAVICGALLWGTVLLSLCKLRDQRGNGRHCN
jgi:hypothetical protein